MILASPWIKKGTVISEPAEGSKPYEHSEYDLTSIISTTRKLLNMEVDGPLPLTKRDGWSATFETVVSTMDAPREDCPLHLPEALSPALPDTLICPRGQDCLFEHDLPLNQLQTHIASVHAYLADVEEPTHTTQEYHSQWVQDHYAKHADRTMRWKNSKSKVHRRFQITAQPMTKTLYKAWYFNGLKHGDAGTYQNSTAAYMTVSSQKLTVQSGVAEEDVVPYCLDGGDGSAGLSLHTQPIQCV